MNLGLASATQRCDVCTAKFWLLLYTPADGANKGQRAMCTSTPGANKPPTLYVHQHIPGGKGGPFTGAYKSGTSMCTSWCALYLVCYMHQLVHPWEGGDGLILGHTSYGIHMCTSWWAFGPVRYMHQSPTNISATSAMSIHSWNSLWRHRVGIKF